MIFIFVYKHFFIAIATYFGGRVAGAPPFVALSSRPHSTPPLSQSAAAPAAYEPHPASVGLVSGGTVATDDLGPTVRRGGGDGGMGGQ